MTMSRPAQARVSPDPEVLAANRGRNAANMIGTLGLHPELAESFNVSFKTPASDSPLYELSVSRQFFGSTIAPPIASSTGVTRNGSIH